MWGSVQASEHIKRAAALAVLTGVASLYGALPVHPEPQRVVSMNLCTDQLAMLVAREGQLHSVSYLAGDDRSSAMTAEAAQYDVNHGLAEEVYLMQPDLVIAGAYTTRATVAMLRRLDIPVVTFEAANSLEDVRARILQMGDVLKREAVAQTLVSDFDTRLAELRTQVQERPRAILYYAGGYTQGDQTLAGQILLAAGFGNGAAEAGYSAGMKMPLEVLAMAAPDIVVTSRPYPGRSRAEEVTDHPVVRSFRDLQASATVSDHDWVCGTPYVLRAIDKLGAARRAMTAEVE